MNRGVYSLNSLPDDVMLRILGMVSASYVVDPDWKMVTQPSEMLTCLRKVSKRFDVLVRMFQAQYRWLTKDVRLPRDGGPVTCTEQWCDINKSKEVLHLTLDHLAHHRIRKVNLGKLCSHTWPAVYGKILEKFPNLEEFRVAMPLVQVMRTPEVRLSTQFMQLLRNLKCIGLHSPSFHDTRNLNMLPSSLRQLELYEMAPHQKKHIFKFLRSNRHPHLRVMSFDFSEDDTDDDDESEPEPDKAMMMVDYLPPVQRATADCMDGDTFTPTQICTHLLNHQIQRVTIGPTQRYYESIHDSPTHDTCPHCNDVNLLPWNAALSDDCLVSDEPYSPHGNARWTVELTFTLPLIENPDRIVKQLLPESLPGYGYIVHGGDIGTDYEPPLRMPACLILPAVRDERPCIDYSVTFHLSGSIKQIVTPFKLSGVKMLTLHVGTYHKAKDIALNAIDAIASIPNLHCLRLETEYASVRLSPTDVDVASTVLEYRSVTQSVELWDVDVNVLVALKDAGRLKVLMNKIDQVRLVHVRMNRTDDLQRATEAVIYLCHVLAGGTCRKLRAVAVHQLGCNDGVYQTSDKMQREEDLGRVLIERALKRLSSLRSNVETNTRSFMRRPCLC